MCAFSLAAINSEFERARDKARTSCAILSSVAGVTQVSECVCDSKYVCVFVCACVGCIELCSEHLKDKGWFLSACTGRAHICSSHSFVDRKLVSSIFLRVSALNVGRELSVCPPPPPLKKKNSGPTTYREAKCC